MEIIEERVNGYLVTPEAGAKGLEQRFVPLMRDSYICAALAARAVDVRDRFSFAKVGSEWDQALGLTDRYV